MMGIPSGKSLLHRIRRDRDEGAATAEYVAILVAACGVVAGILLSSPRIAEQLEYRLCQAMGNSDCVLPLHGTDDEDPLAPCEVSTFSQSYNASGSLFFVTGGGSEFVDLIELSDGDWAVRIGHGADLGAEYALGDFGVTVRGNGQGFSAQLTAAVGVEVLADDYSEWHFGSESEANAFIDKWAGAADAADGGGIPLIGVAVEKGKELYNNVRGKKPPSADVTYSALGVGVNGNVDVSATIAEFGLEGSGAVVYGSSHDSRDNTDTYYVGMKDSWVRNTNFELDAEPSRTTGGGLPHVRPHIR